MVGESQPRTFISYSRKDGAEYAAWLRAWLEARDLSVWQDIVALEGGRDWWSQIEDALRSKALQHFVLVVTPAALASPVVRQEIRLARQEGKTVCPVRGPGLEDLGALPRWIGQVYDLALAEHQTTLIRVLQAESRQKRVPMMAPEPPEDFVSRPREFDALKTPAPRRQGRRGRRDHRGAQGRGRLRQDDARQGARPRPRHSGRLFRRHSVGGAWREAGAAHRHPLRSHRAPDRRAAGARDDQRRRGEARRGARRPPHSPDRRRRLARAGPATLPAGRAALRPAGHDADRQRPAADGASSAGRRHAGEARR